MQQEFTDPEVILKILTKDHGIKLNAIEEKLGVARTLMMSWRRSTTPRTKAELSKKLMEAYPQYLSGEEVEPPKTKIEIKYMTMLEKRINELEEMVEYWKERALAAEKK